MGAVDSAVLPVGRCAFRNISTTSATVWRSSVTPAPDAALATPVDDTSRLRPARHRAVFADWDTELVSSNVCRDGADVETSLSARSQLPGDVSWRQLLAAGAPSAPIDRVSLGIDGRMHENK